MVKSKAMDKEEALKLLNTFIEVAMSQGAIKNFETLDKLRKAIAVLEMYGIREKTGAYERE